MIKEAVIIMASLTGSFTVNATVLKAKYKPESKIVQQISGTGVLSKVPDDSDYAEMATLAKTADLQSTLKAVGAYTVFAPSNNAFRQLSGNTMDSLTKDPAALSNLLRAHIVKGKYTKTQIIAGLTAGKGKMKLTTIDGKSLKLVLTPKNKLQLTDANGDVAQIISFDMLGSNSVLNGINTVLLPAK